jgi:outer membrane protein TolC
MQRFAFVLLLGAAALTGAPGGALAQGQEPVERVTLETARRRAVNVAPGAIAARGEVSAAGWERRAALASLYTPSVTASTNYTRFSEPFFNFGTGAITPNATSATLEARYTLIGGAKLAGLRRSKAAVARADALETATLFRTTLATDAAYYAVLAEHELSRVAAARLQRAEEQLGVARVRVQAGETIATDSLQLLLEVNRARFEVLRRDSAVVVSRLTLGRQIGAAGPVDAEPLDTLVTQPLPLTLAAAVSELRARGPEVEAARAVEREESAGLSADREAYLPDLTLSATAGAYDSEFFPSATTRRQVAVTVSWPIWDGGRREVTVARARARRDAARADREDMERAAAEQMTRAFQGYETARASIELARVAVQVSGENYRVQGARYREGATTILDLLEAQVGLSEAEATLVQSRYAARLALAQIEALLGRRLSDQGDPGSGGAPASDGN